MNNQPWIADDVRASLEGELIEAFKTELTEGPAGTGLIVDEQRFKFVRQELGMYYPDDLHGALPYVLIGFLRFGVPALPDENDLAHVVQLLNIRCHGYDNPHENPVHWQEMRRIARSQEEAVSQFSKRQARSIRLWLEAIQNSKVFLPEWSTSEDLGYAIAYWLEREGNENAGQGKRCHP
jgi:hypothetical protein